MKIIKHSESHVVKLEDGSEWNIFPGDLDLTLLWLPETDLELRELDDPSSTHVLVNKSDGSRVRVIRGDDTWEARQVKRALREG